METLFSFNSSSHPLLLQSSKNRAFYPFIPSSSSTKKPEFVSFYQKRDYNNVDVFHSISLQLKAAIGSVSCKASASDQSSQPENTAGSTKIPSQELQSKTVRVEFQLIRECLFGQEFLVVGNDPILGVWNPLEAIPLKWSEGHIWRAEVDVPINKTIQFMLILKDQTGEFVWQPGPRRVFQTRAQTNKMVVLETWDFEGLQRSSEEEPLEDVTAQSKMVKVKFQMRSQCLVGQEYFVIGDDPILGGWNPSGAIPLKWRRGHLEDYWMSDAIDMQIGKTVQFRFILKDATTGEVISWQARPNSDFTPQEIDADENFIVKHDSAYVADTNNSEAEWKEVPTRPDPFKDEKYDPRPFFDGLFKD